ncbi:vacuolar protein-sorting-associated protein 36-like [Procambarus clarkii]|uniref:vacuolar protein-sorting-associated protein 36-like n=1 Tax=Procambarus clarkii TaxID=6728 RepID=UPI0037429908
MGTCRVGSFSGGSLQDLSHPSGSRGTPSLARSSSPILTSSSTISNSGADIIAPPDDFSSGIVNLGSDEHGSQSSRQGRVSWANLELDLPTSPTEASYEQAIITQQPSYDLPRPVRDVSASAFRSVESLAELYSPHYEPQPAFTLPRRPSQVIYHGQPHLQQQLEREQAQYQQMEQQQYQQMEQQQHQQAEQQQYKYHQVEQLQSSAEYIQSAAAEQYFLQQQQQQCCQQPSLGAGMTVPPPYASLDPSTLYSLHATVFEDGARPSTSYTDWPPLTPTYTSSDYSET